MAHEVAHHGEHEVSIWPLPVGVGVLLIPLAITAFFAWKAPLAALLAGGVGLALIIVGATGWAYEFFTKGHDEGHGWIAIFFFIISEIIIFGTMFVAFWMARVNHAEVWVNSWIPEGLSLSIPAFLTLVLWASSFTIWRAEVALEQGSRSKATTYILITMALGILFTVMHVSEWVHLWHQGFTLMSNMYGTGFYALTGIHTSHVIVGLILQAYALMFILSGKMNEKKMTMFSATVAYWHFVDIMWLLVASTAYVVGGLHI